MHKPYNMINIMMVNMQHYAWNNAEYDFFV